MVYVELEMPASQIPTIVVLFASQFFIFLLSNISCCFQSEYSKMNHYQLSGGAFDRKYVESLQFHKYIPLFILGSFVIFGWVFTLIAYTIIWEVKNVIWNVFLFSWTHENRVSLKQDFLSYSVFITLLLVLSELCS